MSTKTKLRQKLDLLALIGPLTKEPEPKTLQECLYEAGGFPFVARAVAPATRKPEYTADPLPVGTEVQFLEWHRAHFGHMYGAHEPGAIDASVRRWFLVGHKT